jgi:ABC-2 type transport system ATP-binding protein
MINTEKWLQSTGMHEHKDKKVEELSKGMQQKVQFVSAVIHDPDLIILDEPFSGLDPVNAKVMRDMILECKKAGKTIILSTHMMEQAQTLCDRIMMINMGSIVLYDTVDNIRKNYYENSLLIQFNGNRDALNEITEIKSIVYHDNFVEILLKESGTIQALIEKLNQRVEILRFEQSIPSLNDIYIRLVEGSINDKIVNSC